MILLGPRAHDAATVQAWTAAASAHGAKLHVAARGAPAPTVPSLPARTPSCCRAGATLDTAGRRDVEAAWGAELPEGRGLDVGGILEAAAAGELKALWLVGADVIADVPDNDLGRRALEGAPFVVVQDVQNDASSCIRGSRPAGRGVRRARRDDHRLGRPPSGRARGGRSAGRRARRLRDPRRDGAPARTSDRLPHASPTSRRSSTALLAPRRTPTDRLPAMTGASAAAATGCAC